MKEKEIKKLEQVLTEEAVEQEKTQRIISRVSEEEEKTPKVHAKKQYVIVVSDPEGKIQGDFVGWAVQIAEDEAPQTALQKIHQMVDDFNATKKGQKMPVRSVGEGIEFVPARFGKEAGVWKKHAEPVLIVKTDNTIPRIVK